MPDDPPNSHQLAHDALQNLKEQLETAYGNAKSQDIRDLLDTRLDAIDASLTALDQDDIASRTIAINAAADSTGEALKRLDSLKANIQAISDDIGKATQVLDDVDKALSAVKSCFGT